MSHVANAQVVNIPDRNLAAAVRAQLNKETGHLTRSDMKRLTVIMAPEQNIMDLTGLEHAINLQNLQLNGNSITDVNPLSKLMRLRILNLQDNQIQNVHPLSKLNPTKLFLKSNPITVNVPLKLTLPTVIKPGEFIVLSRDRKSSIVGKVNIIYQDWAAFTQANPVIIKSSGVETDVGYGNLLERVNETLDSFRTEGFGGTIELIAHPNIKIKPGDLVISEIMWGRHETLSDNQWVELYSPKKNITLRSNRFALLFTGKYLDRKVIPASELYEGWKVIDRVRNAAPEENVSWELPGLSTGTEPDQSPVSMHREIGYKTGKVAEGSLATSWTASSRRENLLYPSYGTPGTANRATVLISESKRPPMYWVDPSFGGLHRLAGVEEEMLVPSIQNITSLAVDATGGKVYFTEQTSETAGKIHRVDLDGSNHVELATIRAGVPLNLTIDAAGKKLYWTDSRGRIRRANVNGQQVRNVIQNLNSLKLIALDIVNSNMYYTVSNSLWRSNLNGKNKKELLTDLIQPGNLVIADSKIYWTQKTSAKLGGVKRADLDGTNVEELISSQTLPFGVGVDSANSKLYWTNSRGGIQRSNLDGSRIQTVVRGLDMSADFALSIGSIDIEISQQPVVHVGSAQRPPMYWIDTEAGTLHRLIGNEVENFILQVQNATSLAVDTTDKKIYWTEQMGKNRGKIKSANLDGSNVQVLATIYSVPRSIAVDTMRSTLYWTNSKGSIQQSTLNGKQIKNLTRNLKSPENITVDVAGGKLYWTEAPGNIRRANLNDKSIEDIVSGLGTLSGIAISDSRLYWTEITGSSSGKIGRVNLNGSNPRTLATLRSAPRNIAVDSVGKKLYWTDAGGDIRRSNLIGRNIKKVASGLTSLADLALIISRTTTAAAPMNSSLASSETLIPDATGLLSNYPNPFNPETWIPYQLAKPADVTLTIYAVNGEMVRRLELGHQAAGIYQSKRRAAYWDGRNALGELVASGVYFYTLTAGEFSTTRKMLIRK